MTAAITEPRYVTRPTAGRYSPAGRTSRHGRAAASMTRRVTGSESSAGSRVCQTPYWPSRPAPLAGWSCSTATATRG